MDLTSDAEKRMPPMLDALPMADDVVQVLLVDDQPANLEALEAVLASTGCRFVLARSPDEALLALLDQEFAAIVLDMKMPGMTGLELAKLIKGRRRTRDVPIIFLTAYMVEERDILRGYGVGAVDYITKPVSPEVLRSKIAVFAELFRKRRALGRANEALQREIAERQRMEEALRQANQDLEARVEERTTALREADRRKDAFLAALAHELRNPLAALRSAAEVVRLRARDNPDLALPQGVIHRQLGQMTRLIEDLLDVSRITRDALTLRRSRVELAAAVGDALETCKPLVDSRKHELRVSLPSESIWLDGDRTRLSQVFANLLDNAAKYSEPGGHIRLTAEQRGQHVLVKVTDEGLGIEREDLPRIFDLFVQGHKSLPGAYGGLGVGLTLVKRLVEMHGGSVTAHSAGAGRGTEFRVQLPVLAVGPEEVAAPATDAAAPATPATSLRVLIVEDNRDAAETLDVLLTDWGHDTRVAHDAMAALNVASQFRPEVVLLDIGLPKLHGHEVARRIREQDWGRVALLVAITGWGQEADRLRSKAVGIDHHLLKPVDPEALRALINAATSSNGMSHA